MLTTIRCPQCSGDLAFSSALLGRTVRCHRCQHPFAVTEPPANQPTPPPLPVKRRGMADDDRPPSRPRQPDDDRDERGYPPRPSGTAALAGLVALFVSGFLVLAGGIGYILWPDSSSPTMSPVVQNPAPPVEAPVLVEPPKGLDEIIKDAPKNAGGGDPPGFPKFQPQPPPPLPAPNPPPVPVPRPPPGPPPAFARPEALPVRPPPLRADRVEVKLPGEVGQIVPAANGRLLLLHLPAKKQVSVFDVTEGKVVKDIPADDALVAGGMNVFVLYLRGKDTAERWNTKTLEREASYRAPFPGPVRALGMGAGSNGPLVAAVGGGRQTPVGGATLAFFHPATLKEIGYEYVGDANPLGLGVRDPNVSIRVSGSGTLVTAWGGITGSEVHEIAGGTVTRRRSGQQQLLPGPDGSLLFGRSMWYTPAMKVPRERPPEILATMVPAVHGREFLTVRTVGVRAPQVKVYRTGQPAPAAELGELTDLGQVVPAMPAVADGLSQNLVLIPDAKLLVVVPLADRSKLVLRKLDLDGGW